MFSFSTSSYAPVPTESPTSSPPSPPSRPSRPMRRALLLSLLVIAGLTILGGWDIYRPESRTHELLKSTGLVKPDLGMGKVSKHRELVSVVLLVGANDHGILEVVRSVLSKTVGPYELIGVYTDPNDSSERIVETLIQHHIHARVDRHGRGLIRHIAITGDSAINSSSALLSGVGQASGDYVAILNGDDQVDEYGWDRILLTGIKSDTSLLAVSGRAASNLEIGDREVSFTDIKGQLYRKDHETVASPAEINIRDVALRSPILYDARKAREMGWMEAGLERAGLGDIDMCLRGSQAGFACGYYPIGTKTKEEWKSAPGNLPIEANSTRVVISDDIARTWRGFMNGGQRSSSIIQAMAREIEDIPKTIVTAFSGNHQHTVQQWYHTLHHAPYTRFIAYILPSDQSVDPETYASWQGVEVRVFDFTPWPSWVDVTKKRGEYAWKDLIVEEVIRDYGGLVFWLDAGDELTGDFTGTWNEVAEMGMFGISVGGPIWLWTHPATVAYLNMPPGIMDNNNCNGAMWGVNSQHYDAMTKIVRPLFACAKTRECIAPLGSSRANHRQDQAALSAYIHLAGYKCDSHAPIQMGGDAPGDGSKFCDDGTGHWGEC